MKNTTKKVIAVPVEVPVEAPKLGYTATVKLLGKMYTATGETAKEALASLMPQGTARGMSVLTVKNAEIERIKVLNRMQTFNLFSRSRINRERSLKNIFTLFNF